MKTNNLETITHPLITSDHLRRKAVIYVRQSSLENIREDTGSTGSQRDQLRLARQYGWPEHLIEVIDEDLGKSGSSAKHRTGWQRLLNEIGTDGVGAVFAANVSRLSRRIIEYEQLQRLVSDHGTLLFVDNRTS